MFREKISVMDNLKIDKLKFISLFFLFSFITFFINFQEAKAAPTVAILEVTGPPYDMGKPTPYDFRETITSDGAYANANIQIETKINQEVGSAAGVFPPVTSTGTYKTGVAAPVAITYNVVRVGQIYTFTPSPAINLIAGDILTLDNKLRFACNTASGEYKARIRSAAVTLTETIKNIDVATGILNISVTPNSFTNSKNDNIVYTVTLSNNGFNTLYNARVFDTLGSDLQIVSVVPDGSGFITTSFASNIITADATNIPVGTNRTFVVTAKIIGCVNVDHSLTGKWPAFGTTLPVCDDIGGATGQNSNDIPTIGVVNIVEKNPKIVYTAPATINLNWGTAAAVTTVPVTVSNTGLGPANGLYFQANINTTIVDITNVTPGWTYNSGSGRFIYTAGTLANGANANFSFDIKAKQFCPAPGNTPVTTTGFVTWDANYTSDCGTVFSSPITTSNYITNNPAIPTLDYSVFINTFVVNINTTFDYTLFPAITNKAQLGNPVTVTFDVPPLFTSNSATVPYGTVTRSTTTGAVNGHIVWTFDPNLFTGIPTDKLTINVTTPVDPCLANAFHNNQNSILGTVPSGGGSCQISRNQAQSVFVNDSQPAVPTAIEQNRSVISPAITNPEGYQVCQQDIDGTHPAPAYSQNNTLQTEYIFGAGLTATYATAIYNDPLPVTQVIGGKRDMRYVSGSAEFSIDTGAGYGAFTAIPGADITYSDIGSAPLNIKLQSINGGGGVGGTKVRIRYKVFHEYAGTATLTDGTSSLAVFDTSELLLTTVPNCATYPPTTAKYYRTLEYNVTSPRLKLAFNASGSINDCEPNIPVTLEVTKDSFNPLKNTGNIKIEFDETVYRINPASITTAGFQTYGAVAVTPTNALVGNIRTFDFGANDLVTLNDGTGRAKINFTVQKRCGQTGGLSATAKWNNLCTNNLSVVSTYNPGVKKAVIAVKTTKAPPPVTDTVNYILQVTNSGQGDAYDIDVFHNAGLNLQITSQNPAATVPVGSTLTLISAALPQKGQGIGTNLVNWRLDKLPAGETLEIPITATLVSNNGAAIQCGGDTLTRTIVEDKCSVDNSNCSGAPKTFDTGAIAVPSTKVTTTLVTPQSVDMCGTVTTKIRLTNGGRTKAYNVSNVTTLPAELCYITGSGKITKNGVLQAGIFDPTFDGTQKILTWSYNSAGDTATGNNLDVLNSISDPLNDTLEIEFQAKVSCSNPGSFSMTSSTSMTRPCELDKFGPIGVGTPAGATGFTITPAGTASLAVKKPIFSSTFPDQYIESGMPAKTWTLTLTNSGPVDAKNVGGTITLPSNLILDTGAASDTTPPHDGYVAGTGVITFNPGTIANILATGGTGLITIKAKIKDNVSCSAKTSIGASITFGCPTIGGTVPAGCSASCSATPAYSATGGVVTKPSVASLSLSPTTIDSCATGTSIPLTISFKVGDTSLTPQNDLSAYAPKITYTLPTGYEYNGLVSILETSPVNGVPVPVTQPAVGDTILTFDWGAAQKILAGTVEVKFNIRPKNTGSCPVANSTNTLAFEFKDSCTNVIPTVSIAPNITVQKPIVDFRTAPAKTKFVFFTGTDNNTAIVTNGATGISWDISFRNSGSGVFNGTITSTIGSSFNTIARTNGSGGEVPTTPNAAVATWTITNLAAGANWSATVTANHVGGNNTIDLTHIALIDGGCATGCKHTTTVGFDADQILTTSKTAFVSLEDVTQKVMYKTVITTPIVNAVVGERFHVQLKSSFSGNGNDGYTNVIVRDTLPKNGVNPLIKIHTTPAPKVFESLVDHTADWTYTPASAGNSWVASWQRTAPGFITPSEITIEYDAYINDVTPGNPNGISTAIASNIPKSADLLTNTNNTTYNFGGNSYAVSGTASVTVNEPFLTKAKAQANLTLAADGVDSISTTTRGVSPSTLVGGTEKVGYQLTFNNTGNAIAHDISMQDIIPLGMRVANPVLTPLTGAKLNGVDVLPAQISTSYNNATGLFKLQFLKANGFAGIPAGQSLVIKYYTTVDANITGSTTMTNAMRLVNDTSFSARGHEGYSSLPSDDPDVALNLDRLYGNNTDSTQTVITPTNAVKITKSATTEVNEGGNNANTQATNGEKVTYTVVMSTKDLASGFNLNVSALAPTTALAPFPISTFVDSIADGLEVDQALSSIAITAGTTSVAPTLSYAINAVSGKTDVTSNAFDLNPNTDVTVTLVTRVKEKFVKAPAPNVVAGNIINNGNNNVASANTSTTTTDFRWKKTDTTHFNNFSATIAITVVEPSASITKIKTSANTTVAPGDTVSYRINAVTTAGSSTAHNVTITDILPEGMRTTFNPVVDSAETQAPTIKTYDQALGKITWIFNTITPNTTVTINYNVKVDPNLSLKVDSATSSCIQLINEAKLNSFTGLDIYDPSIKDPLDSLLNLYRERKIYTPTASFKVPVSVAGITINPVHNVTGTPGSVVVLPHTIVSCSNAPITINTPVSEKGWPLLVYTDLSTKHDGSVLSATPINTITPSSPGAPVYIVIKEQIPQNTPSSVLDKVSLSVTQTVPGLGLPLTASIIDTVNTSLNPNIIGGGTGTGTLKLIKSATSISDPATGTRANPGEIVTYTIDYTNTGTDDLTGVEIEDITPEGTTLANPLPAFISGAGVVTHPGFGNRGAIKWSVTGNVPAGTGGQIRFSIKID
ncbi:MAG: hypothetical protein AABZ74_12795 [Cyanobacteriota bacterium]